MAATAKAQPDTPNLIATGLIRRQGQRLTHAETAHILRLLAEGLPAPAIAKAVKVNESTVYGVKSEYTDTTVQALARLRSGADSAAMAWLESLTAAASQGNHKPSKDLLASLGVIRETPETAIAIQVNAPSSGLSGHAMPAELALLEPAEPQDVVEAKE